MTLTSIPVRRVVVTGLGVVTPIGVGVNAAWQNLLRGRSGVVRVEKDPEGHLEEHWRQLPSRVAAFVPRKSPGGVQHGHYDPDEFSTAQSRTMSLGMKFGLVAAEEALKNAGLIPDQIEPVRTGAAVGMAMVDGDYIASCQDLVSNGQAKKMSPYFVPRILTNLLCGHISIKFGLRGPNHSVATACATGSHAIGDAYRMIQAHSVFPTTH